MCFYNNGLLQFPDNPPSCFVTAVERVDLTREVKIYPNPFVNKFILEIEGQENSLMDVQIFTSQGLNIKDINALSSHSEIDVSDLPTGVYFMLLNSEDGRLYSKKVVKL